MPTYRCYFLDSRRSIVEVEVIQCADDAEAGRQAIALFHARRGDPPVYHGIEVWDLARLVHSYPPDDDDWVSP
ncbi:MAG: hypothetical protein WDO24_13615 [Pseudomonadota bacterium]